MELEEIRPQLVHILQEHPEQYWTAYSIWLRLQERFPERARLLEDEYGQGVGEGGGAHYRSTSYIANCLSRTPGVDTQYLHTKGLEMSGIRASDDRQGIYRWTE